MGQSYAALLMSCDIPANPMQKTGDSQFSNSVKGDSHQHVSESKIKLNKNLSVEKISSQSSCDKEEHNCQCSLGTCSVVFLPVNAYTHSHGQVSRVDSHVDLSLDFQPFLLFRPPISA